jgi:hypothetical protein
MKLYKYYPENINSIKSLSVNGLWCNYPNSMNDPADCLGYIDRLLSKEQIDLFKEKIFNSDNNNFKKLLNFPDDKIVDFFNLRRRKPIEIYTFCSLSETFDNVLMWSHYASAHTGFVIELEFDDKEIDYHFQKVKYVDNLPDIEVDKVADFLLGRDENMSYILEDISYKASFWNYEREWRIWRSNPSYYRYNKNNLKRVFFGFNSNIEMISIVTKLAGDINPDVEFYFMNLDNENLGLKYTEEFIYPKAKK